MRNFSYVAVILVAVLVVGQYTCAQHPPPTYSAQSSYSSQLPARVNGQPMPSLAPMLERVTPAVVNIFTHTQVPESPLMLDPFFRHFFGVPDSAPKHKTQSLGSGVIIDIREGHVLTNFHVIDKADEISITLIDGRQLKAELIGADPETDVALLKVPPIDLVALPLADSDYVRVGDFVVAIGNPFGLGQTVTSGIISALGRSGLGIEGYEDFIQTDASINPGNSGGALVNLNGELVGINTAILAPSGGNIGIGFAIPINMVKQVIDHLLAYGEVRRGTLGFRVQDLNPDLAEAFKLDIQRGAVIIAVDKSSPAEKAGFQLADVITEINGKRINSASDARNRIGLLRVGDTANVTLLRNGHPQQLSAQVVTASLVEGRAINTYLEGLVLKDSKKGIIVADVEQHSFAWTVGFRKGDMIIGFNRRKVKDLKDLKQRMSQRPAPFTIQVVREGDIYSIWLQ